LQPFGPVNVLSDIEEGTWNEDVSEQLAEEDMTAKE
jgi:hypothetical protein